MHKPVLLNEVIQIFKETQKPEIKTYFDGTFGRGGHASQVILNFPDIHITATDQDLAAIEYGKTQYASWFDKNNFKLVHANFSDFSKLDLGTFDLMLVDLGVSSPQLDEAERGFSFYHDGPLDMRMNQKDSLTAADIVNTWDEDDLMSIFKNLGEVLNPYRVVKAIVADRGAKPFTRTSQLSSLIERIDGWRVKGHHPATRYFMALRLKVNEELSVVEKALPDLMKALNPGGRLIVLTFHSLEDRIVKNIFKNSPEIGKPVNKKVIQPEWLETKENPRARSAKLRAFERNSI